MHSSFVMGIEESPVDHYESLMQRLWTIPHESVAKTADSVGCGNFGKVLKGYIQRGESKVEAALHVIEGTIFYFWVNTFLLNWEWE